MCWQHYSHFVTPITISFAYNFPRPIHYTGTNKIIKYEHESFVICASLHKNVLIIYLSAVTYVYAALALSGVRLMGVDWGSGCSPPLKLFKKIKLLFLWSVKIGGEWSNFILPNFEFSALSRQLVLSLMETTSLLYSIIEEYLS